MDLLKLLNFKLYGVCYCTYVRVIEHCMYVAISFNNYFKRINLQGIVYFMVIKWLIYFK